MTREERFKKIMPPYLKHDIDEYMKYKDDPTCTVFRQKIGRSNGLH